MSVNISLLYVCFSYSVTSSVKGIFRDRCCCGPVDAEREESKAAGLGGKLLLAKGKVIGPQAMMATHTHTEQHFPSISPSIPPCLLSCLVLCRSDKDKHSKCVG